MVSSAGGPLVTFVMAAWKPRPDWLLQAVRSVLDQHGCRLELIVVDDGSPRPVAPLLGSISDERLRVLRTEHAGVSHARSVGFRESRGDYLRYVDSDDVVERESTARLVRLAGGRDDVITYGSILVCDEQLRPISWFTGWHPGLPLIEYLRGRYDLIDFKPVGIISSSVRGSALRDCLLGRFRAELMAMLLPRRVIAEVEWPHDLAVSHDWDFLLRALEHAHVRGERAVASYYRQHGSQTTRQAYIGLGNASVIIDRYFDRHRAQRGSQLERGAKARIALRTAGAYAFSSHEPFAVAGRGKHFATHVRRAAALAPLVTLGRLIAWSPWLLSRLARKRGS